MGTSRLFRFCDGLTEAVIYFMIVFSPWAFGTTQDWSIWTMNVCGYVLGALLVTKWFVRWSGGIGERKREGKRLARSQKSEVGCQKEREDREDSQAVKRFNWGRRLTIALAGFTVLILTYCLVSALNARALFLEGENRFEYFDNYIKWLPHSYDSRSTWKVFWQYLGLAFFFWATRDWLLRKTASESRGAVQRSEVESRKSSGHINGPKVQPLARGYLKR